MSPFRALAFFIIILMAGSVAAQFDGYTCTNEYLDCGDVVESEDYTLRLYTISGWPGDTIWLPVGLPPAFGETPDTVSAFAIFIDWDSTYLSPLTDPSDSTVVQHRRFGLFESVEGDFFAMLSQNPADENAIAVFYNLGMDTLQSVMPPGDYGVMFSVGFVVKPTAGPGASSVFEFHQVNEYLVTDSALMEAYCTDCRRTQFAIKYDCEVEIYDTISTNPLIIDTLMDTSSCFAVRYPATVEGYFGLPMTEHGRIYLSGVDGLIDGTIPIMSGPVTFHFTYQNYDADEKVQGVSNGMVLFGNGDATWSATHGHEFLFDPNVAFGFWREYEFSWDGFGRDTVGFLGNAADVNLPMMPAGYHGPGVYISVDIDNSADYAGETFCIDSSFYPPAGHWKWSFYPGPDNRLTFWDGPYCYDLSLLTPPVEWVVAPVSYNGDHCNPVVLDYEATSSESSVLTFTNEGAFGSVTPTGNNTCQFIYQPVLADVGATLVAVIGVSDGVNPMVTTETNLTFTNQAPTIVCGGIVVIGAGNTGSASFTVDDVDCDPSTVSICGINPTPFGSIYLDGNEVIFETEPEDVMFGSVFVVDLCVSDGVDGNTCSVEFSLGCCEAFEVQIEKTHGTIQGTHEIVDVVQTKGSEDMGGWNFMIAYDASALNFQAAIPGAFHTTCGWEYFNYRFGPNGNCGNACPSGLLEVLALAETNNGPNHPLCLSLPLPAVLFSLDFLVSNDRTLECQYVPIRFYWTNCSDNSIAYHPADDPLSAILGVSRRVYDYDLIGRIEDMYTGYPTYTGFQAECLDGADPDKPTPIQFVDFYNGGIDIVCADSIDDRGDINLNGVVNEVADAVLYSNYFVHGLLVFNVNIDGQIAASDVNADGITLSVADLVYQIRIITGDALPYPKVGVEAATYAIENGVMSVDTRMAAAFVVLGGRVNPTLLAMNMEMTYAFDGMNTRVLVTKIERGAGFDGDFLAFDANIVSVEFATYDGAPVNTKPMPSDYRLFQNYPNPFNPKTTISFGLPKGGDYNLSIYNVTGQKVASFEGTSEAGTVAIDWDGSEQASGVYFYKLETDNFADTKKMVLLK